jgi:hypothetical protein
MNKQRLAIVIAAGIGMLATFMPWVKAPFVGSINGTAADGWTTFFLFGVAVVIALLNDRTTRITGNTFYAAIAGPGAATLFALWKIMQFSGKKQSNDIFCEMMGSTVTIEFGLYLIVLAGVASVLLAYLIKDETPVTENK